MMAPNQTATILQREPGAPDLRSIERERRAAFRKASQSCASGLSKIEQWRDRKPTQRTHTARDLCPAAPCKCCVDFLQRQTGFTRW